ncbi:uncharacterized protein LOC141699749 [Apium graveolens]|uniref:PHD-type domain-containing protein n=1 Tax=Apium graveolens TaxID=4045 RepID=A0A6L5BFQ6_APIGR|nr:hypothetical protein AG4045_025681 [Apium graveolens]
MMMNQRLVMDEKVEVRSIEDGFLGSWHSGTVISVEKGIRKVKYDHLLSESNDKIVQSVNVNDGVDCFLVNDCCFRGIIRPVSPLIEFDMWGVKYGQCVDVFYLDAWWEGVVFDFGVEGRERRVFFPDLGDELGVDVGKMRVSQDWDEGSGAWKTRGKWLLIELIDEFEKEGWPVVVSIKQIWYDVRVKKGFGENVKEWTCLRSDVWRELLEEVLVDNLMLTMKELYRELEFSGVKGLEGCCRILELEGSELRDLIKSKPFGGDELVLVESDALDVLPLSSSVKTTVGDEAQRPSPLEVATVRSSIHDELFDNGTCAKDGDSCYSSRKVLKKSKHNIWRLADIAPKCCDDAIEVYLNCQLSKNKDPIPHQVTVNMRRHLLFLGWKVEYLQKEGFRRWRYTQPDGDEKCFNSLIKVCEQIFSDSAKGSRFPVDEQNRLPDDVDNTMVLTPSTEKFQGCNNELVIKNSPAMSEFVYCPQAVINYHSLEVKETVHPKDHDKHKDMQLKAKNHLSAVGWKLTTANRNGKKESRYRSPWGKLYFSLRSACKAYLDENRNVLKLADSQLTGESQCSAIETEEFRGKPGKKRKINARHLGSCTRSPKSRKKEVTCKQQHQNNQKEDDVCSVCHSYGTLILCDKCPSAFHSRCLGLKEHPDGAIWFCPSCCCRICGGGENSTQIEVSTDDSFISCNQCERQYHISCLGMKDIVPDYLPKGYWFCNKKCEQISFALQKLLGKPVQVEADGTTWTLLKYVNPEESDQDPSDIANSAENCRKLNVAVGVMHECFEPLEEPWTRSDLAEDVIFNRWSKLNRLNFRGFYTVLLEKNDELISAATVRIYGEKVAEIPLVATRFRHQKQGRCRMLLNKLEKVLSELGVEKLVLPAVRSLLDTWTSSFGFSVMSESERLELLDYTFLNFRGTTMCQKPLSKNPCIDTTTSLM